MMQRTCFGSNFATMFPNIKNDWFKMVLTIFDFSTIDGYKVLYDGIRYYCIFHWHAGGTEIVRKQNLELSYLR